MFNWLITIFCLFAVSLSAETKVLAFSGSLREESVNKKLVVEAARLARDAGATATVIDLKDFPIPFYNGDVEDKEGLPEKAKQLQKLFVASNVIFVASPEYNGSLSGVLKNMLDWLSRVEEEDVLGNPFAGKKLVLMSASPGLGGGARGLAHLKTVLENVGAKVEPQQFTLPSAYEAFDEQGHLKDPKKQAELKALVDSVL